MGLRSLRYLKHIFSWNTKMKRMNKEYDRLENFINVLKSTGKIRLAKSEFRFYSKSVDKTLLSKIQEIKIADGIFNFYKQIDFINLQWYVADNSGLKFI